MQKTVCRLSFRFVEMTRIKYNSELMKLMSFFESITHAKLKDCFIVGSQTFFVVQPGEIGKALGRNASTVKKLQKY